MSGIRTLFVLLGLFTAVSVSLPVRAQAAEPAHADAEHSSGGNGAGDHGHAPKGPMTADKADVDLAVWTIVTFVVFLLVLTKAAWKPLTEGLDKRERSMRDSLAAAEEAQAKAESLLAKHESQLAETANQVRAMLDEARRDAEHSKQAILTEAQQAAEATTQRALAEIEQARTTALTELFEMVSKTVSGATEKVIGRSLSPEDHDRLVRESLAGLTNLKA
jgi:F-type H+-transporting ATPase subunit b